MIGACGKHGSWVAGIEDKTASGMRRDGKWDRVAQACVAHSSHIEVATIVSVSTKPRPSVSS